MVDFDRIMCDREPCAGSTLSYLIFQSIRKFLFAIQSHIIELFIFEAHELP